MTLTRTRSFDILCADTIRHNSAIQYEERSSSKTTGDFDVHNGGVVKRVRAKNVEVIESAVAHSDCDEREPEQLFADPQTHELPVSSLRDADSPRVEGESMEHIRLL